MAGKPKGSPKTGGRQKGTPNKITKSVREAVIEAFIMVGGAKYLRTLATSDPRSFVSLLGKAMPRCWPATRAIP